MKIKERIELRKKKVKEYWDNLDVDKEIKIENIKRSRDKRDFLSCCFIFVVIILIMLVFVSMAFCNLLNALASKFMDVDNLKRINDLSVEDVYISSAAYEDVINDSNSIVNFNQLFNYNSVVGNANFSRINNNFKVLTSSDFEIDLGIVADFVTGHKYFVYVNSTGSNLGVEIYRSGVTSVSFYSTSIYTSTVTNNLKFYLRSLNDNLNADVSIYFIDLTFMFGTGNEPDLIECQSLFVADYYSYNVGTPVSFSTIEAYNNGINSVLSSTTFETITPADFYNNFTSYTYVPTGTDVIYSGLVYQDTGNWIKLQFNSLINTNDYSDYYACGYLPLTRSLIAGANCQISVYAYGDFGAGSTVNNYFNVCAVNSSGQVIVLAKSPILGTSNVFASTIDFSFDVPFAADYILIVPQRSGYNYYFKDFSINQRVINLDLLQETNYSNGYKEAEEKYSSILDQYASGGDKYNQILNYGKQLGREEAHTYTFGYLMTSVVEAPLNAILNLFNFDFLGYNMKDFVTLLLTLSVIIVVIRLFMGGKS